MNWSSAVWRSARRSTQGHRRVEFQLRGTSDRVEGPAPAHAGYRSFATFSDVDGNRWLLQEVTAAAAGRIEPGETTFASANDLASALRRAAAAHGKHEARTGRADPNWPDWYAAHSGTGSDGAPKVAARMHSPSKESNNAL
jgi:hypothetical protein